MKTHELKTWPVYFEPVRAAVKSFEVRRNDRGFRVGDRLKLVEWCPVEKRYTGRYCFRVITYILERAHDFGILRTDFVVMAIAPEKNCNGEKL